MKKSYVYGEIGEIQLEAVVHLANNCQKGKTLLYIHGGGMVLGDKNDLPQTYIDMLTTSGYNLIAFDYPLAPEVNLLQIRDALFSGVDWFLKSHQSLGISLPHYFIFGRSAGAYLSLLISNEYQSVHQKGIISFYGYSDLMISEFHQPNPFYLTHSLINPELIHDMLGDKIKVSASVKERYLLYMYYRQTRDWINQILPDKIQQKRCSLSDQSLMNLPPTFITASRADNDVPFSESEKLHRLIPNNHFYPVKGLEHDFDRNDNHPISIKVYQNLITWLDQF